MRVAVIDLGTNTIRLLVAEWEENHAPAQRGKPAADGRLVTLFQDQKIARLGEGLHVTGKLSPQAMERSVGVIRRFYEASLGYSPTHFLVAGTSAVRNAENRRELAQKIRESTSLPLTVISGEEEARLSLLGSLMGIRRRKEGVVLIDIGGGSTEYIHAVGESLRSVASTPLGAVRLTETHLTRHPVLEDELERLTAEVNLTLERDLQSFKSARDFELVGTAGTITTIAAIDLNLKVYDADRVNNHRLTRSAVWNILERLAPMTLEERLSIEGLEKGREDLIISGLVMVLSTFEFFGKNEMVVSDFGLREGLALDLLFRGGKLES